MPKRVHFSASKATSLHKNGAARKKEGGKSKKKPWDTTVSDLTVHKLSRDELDKRSLSHQSRNVDAAKHELYEKAKENYDLDSSGNLRPSPLATRGGGQKFAALQRSLQGKQLHEVLAESDRALRVVKDMFGDDPMRYTCQPNVTVAPHIVMDKTNLERTLMESQRDGPTPTALASPGGIRDETVLELAPRKPALNDLPTPTELSYEETEDSPDTTLTPDQTTHTPQGRGYKPSLDLKRFQALIEREETGRKMTPEPLIVNSDPLTQPVVTSEPLTHTTTSSRSDAHTHQERPAVSGTHTRPSENIRENDSKQRKKANQNSPIACPDRTKPTLHVHVPLASNREISLDNESLTGLSDISSIGPPTERGRDDDTVESDTSVAYNKDHTPVNGPALSDHPLHMAHKMTPVKRQETAEKIHGELQELEKLVHGLNQELQDYEQSTSFSTPSLTPPPTNGTLSGITSSLLTSVTKMTHYLRESEAQLKGEMAVRGHLIQTMTEQQNLMDALTTDVVKLQKENVALTSRLKESQHNTTSQLLAMQNEISDLHKKLSTLALQPHMTNPLWSAQPLRTGTTFHQPYTQASPLVQSSTSTTPLPHHSALSTNNDSVHPYIPSTVPQAVTVSTQAQANPYIYAQQSPLSYPVTTDTASVSHQPEPIATSSSIKTAPNTTTYSTHANSSLGNFFSQVQTIEIPRHPPYTGQKQYTSNPLLSSSYESPQSELPTYNPSKITPLDDSFAPPPPPLSVALQVPMLNGHTQTQTSIFSPVSSSTGLSSTVKPMFDVTSFLNSLGQLGSVDTPNSTTQTKLSRAGTVSQNSTGSDQHTTTVSSTHTAPSNFTVAPNTSQASSHKATVQSSSHRVLQVPDLSVSLLSTELPSHTESATSLGARQGIERHHLYANKEETTKRSFSDSRLVHPGVDSTRPQGGWFALTSHISQQ